MPTGRQAAQATLPNDEGGYKALLKWLEGRLEPAETEPAETVWTCLEASGGYETAAAEFLSRRGLRVSVVNPQRVAAYANSQLRRTKTDRADARLLARFCQREEPEPWQPPAPNQRKLRRLTRGLETLKQERDRLKNRLRREKSPAVAESLGAVLETLAEEIQELKRKLEAHITQTEQLRRRRDLLETIPGVGRLTAARVLAELGDPARFESARQAAAYAGLTPAHHQSGTSVKRRSRLSKVGCARLRKALYFPALTALRCNAAVKTLAARLAKRGKHQMVIVGAAMRKLLHICYGVLKNERPFDASLHPGT